MTIFYLAIVSTYLLSLLANMEGGRKEKVGLFFTLIIMFILVMISGLRNGIGDTGAYKHSFNIITPDSIQDGGYEPGFMIFLLLLKEISNDPQFMIMVTSLIVNVSNILMFRYYSRCFELTTFLYIASGYYIVTMNGIRQSMVAAIFFLATVWIEKGHFKMYLALTIFLSTFHGSAFIMIPVYFIVREEAWSKRMRNIMMLTVVGLVLYGPLYQILMKLLEGTKYGGYADFNEGGANIIRIAVSAVPVILAYINREELKKRWDKSNIFVNLSLINFIIMSFSYFNWIFARFTIYFKLYSFILLPMTIKHWKNTKEKRILYYFLIIFYLLFFWYDNAVILRMNYTSDFQFMNIFK